ncbi:MAG: alpha/beta hydrolase [Treponema sp.]|jgi:acetyl esterase/lipase|nr:alpha/beta hydrolase [Treponema sp.]
MDFPAERKYSQELLDLIRKKQRIVREGGIDILVKPVPDDDRPGAMDPRLLAETLPIVRGLRGILVSLVFKLMLMTRNPRKLARRMRRLFNNVDSIPVTGGVSVISDTVSLGDIHVPIRVYRTQEDGEPAEAPKPVFLYIHGGGFAAGHPGVVEEMVKQVTRNTRCLGVQVDYRLAPEHPYPAALDDCYGVLKWLYKNAGRYGGDGERILIAGDSAGGNLAAVCAMKDRDEGTRMVKAQALLYPVLNMAGKEDRDYHFSLDQYRYLPEQKKAARFRITAMRSSSSGILGLLLGVKDESLPYLSPYLGDLRGLPPCIILFGEFDFFRLENEAYARKLVRAGVPVKAVRYSGMGHAFAEPIGVQPQAEDCMMEIGAFMTENFAVPPGDSYPHR